ncbi:hypothetical protein [Agromyces humi]|uniref:hypothetical protein n=1 Tax=Agromyces humi TaxID=1766800 RepID=UPI001359F4B6|nr:hypothetical protein [Agromyces humi]
MTAGSDRPVTLTIPVHQNVDLRPDRATAEIEIVLAGRKDQDELLAELAGLHDALEETLEGVGWELFDLTEERNPIRAIPGTARLEFIVTGTVEEVDQALRATGFLDSGDLVVDDILNAADGQLDTNSPKLGTTIVEWSLLLEATPEQDVQRDAVRAEAIAKAQKIAGAYQGIVGAGEFRVTELVEHVADDESLSLSGEEAPALLASLFTPVGFDLLVDVTLEAAAAPRPAGPATLAAVEADAA